MDSADPTGSATHCPYLTIWKTSLFHGPASAEAVVWRCFLRCHLPFFESPLLVEAGFLREADSVMVLLALSLPFLRMHW